MDLNSGKESKPERKFRRIIVAKNYSTIFPMPDLGEMAVEACYSSFRKHCVEVHGLQENDDSQMFLDLGKWTLTLLK